MLLLIIQPLAVGLGLAGLGTSRPQASVLSWFGIRGIGSIYYLMYAIGLGVAPRRPVERPRPRWACDYSR